MGSTPKRRSQIVAATEHGSRIPCHNPKPLIALIESSSAVICLTGPGRLLTSTAASTPGPAAPYTAISRTHRISSTNSYLRQSSLFGPCGYHARPLSFRLACELPQSSVGDCPIEAQLRSRVRAPDRHARNGRLGPPGAALALPLRRMHKQYREASLAERPRNLKPRALCLRSLPKLPSPCIISRAAGFSDP